MRVTRAREESNPEASLAMPSRDRGGFAATVVRFCPGSKPVLFRLSYGGERGGFPPPER